MHSLFTAIAILCGTCAAAFWLAGSIALFGSDEQERAELKQRLAEARRKSRADEHRVQMEATEKVFTLEQIARHWDERRSVRGMIWLGLVLIVVAIISGAF